MGGGDIERGKCLNSERSEKISETEVLWPSRMAIKDVVAIKPSVTIAACPLLCTLGRFRREKKRMLALDS